MKSIKKLTVNDAIVCANYQIGQEKKHAELKTPQYQKRQCFKCHKEEECLGDYKKCAGCSKVAYCGVVCQKADSKEHKVACKKAKVDKKPKRKSNSPVLLVTW